jgi:hypothetical protein
MKVITSDIRLYICVPDAGLTPEQEKTVEAAIERASDRLQEAIDGVTAGVLAINAITGMQTRHAGDVPRWVREIAANQYVDPEESAASPTDHQGDTDGTT